MSRIRGALRDPYLASVAVLVGLGTAGFVAIGLGAVGAAGSEDLAEQLPYAVSGGLGGIALVVLAVGLLVAQRRRLAAARRRADLERVVRAGEALLEERSAR